MNHETLASKFCYMSNKASSHLFELIKSLNKSEKRYFKLFSSRHTIGEENGYIRLFDFIDRMDSYQEDLIFMHFKGQALLNKFSITKARLYENILKSLDTFYASTSLDAQLYRLIHSAEILYNKGLYKQAEKVLISAGKKAEKHERLNLLLEIKQKQKRLIENELYREIDSAQIDELFEDEKRIITEIELDHTLWHTKSLLFHSLNSNGKIRNVNDAKKLKNLVDKISEMEIGKSATRVKYLYHHIHSAYYFSVNDLQKSFNYLEQNLVIVKSNEVFLSSQPNILFSLLTNCVYISTKLGKYDVARQRLLELKALRTVENEESNIDLDIKYFSSVCSLELYLLIEQGSFDKAENLVEKIEEAYHLYGDNISVPRKAYIDFKVGVVYMSLGEYSKALVWINKILNEARIDQKEDIYCFARLLSLILHFELGNSTLLPYSINAARRGMRLRQNIYRSEEVFLKALGQISRMENVFDLQEILVPFEQELQDLKNNPDETVVFEYFDFLSWVRSKIVQKSFADVSSKERSVKISLVG